MSHWNLARRQLQLFEHSPLPVPLHLLLSSFKLPAAVEKTSRGPSDPRAAGGHGVLLLCGDCVPLEGKPTSLSSCRAASAPAHTSPTPRNDPEPSEDTSRLRGLTLPRPWRGSGASRMRITSSKTSLQGGKQIRRTRAWRTALHVQMEGRSRQQLEEDVMP